MSKRIKYPIYIFGGLSILFILIALGFTIIMNAPKASVKEKAVDFTLSATELFEEYSENQSVADQKFIDQVIQISGQIFEISTDQQGATVFVLTTGGKEAGVLCTLELGERDKVISKKIGDAITLKGVCTGMLMEVVLNRCRVVE